MMWQRCMLNDDCNCDAVEGDRNLRLSVTGEPGMCADIQGSMDGYAHAQHPMSRGMLNQDMPSTSIDDRASWTSLRYT